MFIDSVIDVVEEHDEFSGLREMLGIASKYIYYVVVDLDDICAVLSINKQRIKALDLRSYMNTCSCSTSYLPFSLLLPLHNFERTE